MKIPIDLNEMTSRELLTLARKAIREFNDRNLDQYKLVMK